MTRLAASSQSQLRRHLQVALLMTGALLLVLLLVFQGSSQYVYQLDLAMLAAVGALGLNLITGYAGQISIGAAAFLGIGAYSVVITAGHLPFPLPIVAGSVAAAIVGIAIGIPSLRLRGVYLLFSTLVLQYVFSYVANEYDTHTGSPSGHTVPTIKIGSFALTSQSAWCVAILVLLIVVYLFVRNISRSGYGRALALLRTNEDAAEVLGIDVVRLKLQTFGVSSAILGCAGAVSAYFVGFVSYASYPVTLAISYLAMILIGGLASVGGSIFGAFVVSLIPFALKQLSTHFGGSSFIQTNGSNMDDALYALLAIVFIFRFPGGLSTLPKALGARGRRTSMGSTTPSALADAGSGRHEDAI